jgi:rubrerythrin
MESSLAEVLREAIIYKKNSFDFYLRAAETVPDMSTKLLFKHLADEQVAQLYIFHTIYQGTEFGADLKTLMKLPVKTDHPPYHALTESNDASPPVHKALSIAMNEEMNCICRYISLLTTTTNRRMKKIFMQSLQDTRKHYELIQAEYMRVLGIFTGTDQNQVLAGNS